MWQQNDQGLEIRGLMKRASRELASRRYPFLKTRK
jgi:hypothetical protein